MTSIEAIDPAGAPAPRRAKRDVHGWVAIDKAVGVTSTQVVSTVKRLYAAKRAGHAGTLDPLASGALPIALGEATKTVPFVMEGRKSYRFTVRWGEERDTELVIAALERNKKFLRGEVAQRVNLKFAPDIRFRIDDRFDEAERIEKLLRTPAVQRDLTPDSTPDSAPDSDKDQ